MNTQAVILIVDDVPTNLSVLMEFLENTGHKVLVATDGEAAIEQTQYAMPDIILLDVMMPGIDGFETCRRLKANDQTRDIPVIFMTALSETVDKVLGFQMGAVDYITKPLQQEEVVARVNAHITLYRQKREIEHLRQQDLLHYEQLSRMKDEILSTTSHDLKNPLTTIMLSVEILRAYLNSTDERVLEKLGFIEKEANYMRDLISNLLDLARLQTGVGVQKSPISLKELLETTINHATTSAAMQSVTLRIHLPRRDVTVPCDPAQIRQALENLISNAVKYSPKGASVEIRAELVDGKVDFQVVDMGIGIPEKDIPHVFDRFYRVDTKEHRRVTGTGLGLAIVREIVHHHGGHVAVASQIGMGSTFSFSLPL